MKYKLPQLFSLILVFVMVIGLLPLTTDAKTTYDDFTCTFTTFDDLKKLVATADPDITWASYAGTEPLVIESNLTLYPGLALESLSNAELQVPAGVTFRTSDYMFFENVVVDGTLFVTEFEADNVTLNGTLDGEYIHIYNSLNGSGKVKCSDTFICDFSALDSFDLNNISANYANYVSLRFPIANMNELEALHAMASQDSRSTIEYGCYIQEFFPITKSLSFPKNTVLGFRAPSVINAGCTLEINGSSAIGAPLTVNGTLVNNATIAVAHGEDSVGAIAFSGSDAYSGTGELVVYCENRDAISSVITGIDLSEFQITERNDEDWELGLMGQRWHLKYVGSGHVQPEPTVPTITGTYTTDITMPASDLGVSAPDAVLRATLTFTEDGKATVSWEAIDLTAFKIFFHDMFVSSYYAMAYGAGITDIYEIEAFCQESTGMSVSEYMDTIVTDEAMRESFTPPSTAGKYTCAQNEPLIYTDLPIMEVPSDPTVPNSFVVGNGILYLNATSWDKPDYTFVCTAK